MNWHSHEILGVGRKDSQEEEEPSVLFLKATSHQNSSCCSDAPLCLLPKMTCQAVSGAVELIIAKPALSLSLSKSVGVTVVAMFCVSARLNWATSLQLFPQREKLWDQMVELWSQRTWVSSACNCYPLATCDIFTCEAWDCVVIWNQSHLSAGDK